MKPISAMFSLTTLFFGVLLYGCGTVDESTSDTWDNTETPAISETARLEYRVDSLTNETRRLNQQLEALSTENRNLTARNAELETKINEMAAAPKPEPTPAPAMDVASGYDGALAAFRGRNFSGAISAFEALLNGNVREDLADNCHYWMGESYYGMKQYTQAAEQFKMVLDYKRSEKKDDAQLMLGNTYLAMGDKAAAKDAYNKLISTYPISPFVQKAQEKLARLQ
jgi:tol-pal system protein YbgF